MKPKTPIAELFDRQPPCSVEAEQAVLGSILHRPACLDDVGAVLRPEDFYDDANAVIFRHLMRMHDSGRPVDLRLLVESLRASGEDALIGGEAYLARLSRAVATPAHAVYHADIVAEKARYRRAILVGADLLKRAYDEDGKPEQIVAAAETAIGDVLDVGRDHPEVDAGEAVDAALKRIAERKANRDRCGVLTGFYDFDRDIGGLFPGELVILAARPGCGKTTLAMQIAMQSAEPPKLRPVLLASLEMAASELMLRWIAGKGQVPLSRARSGDLDGEQDGMIEAAAGYVREARLKILDRPVLTVADIRRAARRLHRQEPLSMIVVDYAGRVTPADPKAQRYIQVGQIANDLKTLARELDVPILLLAQLNREAENGKKRDHQPKLSHLRESGNLEQDADMVLFLHREEKFRADADLQGKAELIVAKNRNGPEGVFELAWCGEEQRYAEPSHEWVPEFV